MKLSMDDLKKLQQKKYRQHFGCFLAEGEHLVLELQKAAEHNPGLRDCQLYITEKYQDWPSGFRRHLISERQMSLIAATQTPQGILAVIPMQPWLQGQGGPTSDQHSPVRAIYLHEVQDPGNLGMILRTLAWFGGFRLLLSPGCVDPFNPKVVRASMGALFHVPLELDVSLDAAGSRFGRIALLDMNGKPVTSGRFRRHTCFMFGNEARGVPDGALGGLATEAFSIPGQAAIESLNLAAAVSICVYELGR